MVRFCRQFLPIYGILLLMNATLLAQSSGSQAASGTIVPTLVRFSGALKGASSRLVGITFAFYRDQQGGAPLWLETQSVSVDATGHYAVQLGSTHANGMPKELFSSGDARWLEVRAEGRAEQPRVLLLSVPYALKAADAETLGGLPAAAFMLARPAMGTSPTGANADSSANSAPPTNGGVTGLGTVNSLPLWDTSSDIVSSVITQTGSGSTAHVGINTATPTATLDVKGSGTFRGTLGLTSSGAATPSSGKNSFPFLISATSFNSASATSVTQNFRWQAEPVANNSTSASGKLNLLFSSSTATAQETGLSIASNGVLRFAAGQTFPGTGTITAVTAGTALTGGGTAGSVTLNLDTTKVPQLSTPNTFTGNQNVNGNLTATGTVTGSAFQIGSNLFGFGSYATQNAFVGFAGNSAMTGGDNAGSGPGALASNTTGVANTANGWSALHANQTGSDNTAIGAGALQANTAGGENTAVGINALQANSGSWSANTGSWNTAIGGAALASNTTGSFNTANGDRALAVSTTGNNDTATGDGALSNNTTGTNNTGLGVSAGTTRDGSGVTANYNTFLGAFSRPLTGSLTNATAIGAQAEVDVSNALVLGSINGVNAATADTNVGIGTTTPAARLDVHGTANFTGLVTFASGQTFPGTGTITAVNPGTGLTGGGTSGPVTLSLNSAYSDGRYAQLAANNTFSGVQTINNSVGIGTAPNPVFALQTMGTIRSEAGGLSVGGSAPVTVDAPFSPGGRFTILPNGNVGINTASPTTTLDVAGNIDSRGTLIGASLNVAGAGVINGGISTSAGITTGAGATVGGPLNVAGNSKLAGSLTIKNDPPMNAAPRMYFNAFFPGDLGDVAPGAFIVPSKNILITRMTIISYDYDLPCTPPGTISIENAANFSHIYDLNLGNVLSWTDSGPIAIPIAAGTQLIVFSYQAACVGDPPNNVAVNVEYMMQ